MGVGSRPFPAQSPPNRGQLRVAPSGYQPCVRGLAVALLGLAGVTAAPRPALAAGCHAQARPTLGLDFSWEVETPTVLRVDVPDQPGPRVVPVPCPRETPARLAGDLPAGPALNEAPEPLAPSSVRSRSHPESSRRSRHLRTSRLD